MTTTLTLSPAAERARSASVSVPMSASSMMSVVNADAPVAAGVPACAAAPATPTDVTYVTNQWLGGIKGFGFKHATGFATKRFIPGRLDGMT